MKYLIVTADDLGLTKSVNEGIAKAMVEGIVKTFSVLPTGEAFEDACLVIKALRPSGISAHLALTETRPVSSPSLVKTLITKDGSFFRHHADLLLALFLKRISREHVYIELRNQLDLLKKVGQPIVNLSSHEHIHMMPGLTEIFVDLAREYKIPTIRFLNEEGGRGPFIRSVYRSAILTCLNRRMKKRLDMASIRYPDRFLGFLESGAIDEEAVIRMVEGLKDGVTELVAHPGFIGPEIIGRYPFQLNCERELHGLTSSRTKKRIESNKIKLISYADFINLPLP